MYTSLGILGASSEVTQINLKNAPNLSFFLVPDYAVCMVFGFFSPFAKEVISWHPSRIDKQ